MNDTAKELTWVGAGVVAWFGLHYASPRAAAYVLIALVVYALVKVGPQLAKGFK